MQILPSMSSNVPHEGVCRATQWRELVFIDYLLVLGNLFVTLVLAVAFSIIRNSFSKRLIFAVMPAL
ncbi:hypothetical protein KSC_052960 [Ktedonobacter sp. SOSP1-52]|nr:hypothetical protein KSC_052960 [Ktedonobacter sp. SOSP1-52]